MHSFMATHVRVQPCAMFSGPPAAASPRAEVWVCSAPAKAMSKTGSFKKGQKKMYAFELNLYSRKAPNMCNEIDVYLDSIIRQIDNI